MGENMHRIGNYESRKLLAGTLNIFIIIPSFYGSQMCAVDFTLFRECLAYNYRFKRRPDLHILEEMH